MEILKCEMCGGIAKARGKGTMAVCCEICGQHGPRRMGRDLAIEVWNRQQELLLKGKMYETLIEQVRKEGIA